MKAREWYALWRFLDMDEALAAIPELHISTGINDNQGTGVMADALEEGEVLTFAKAGEAVEVCLSLPVEKLTGRGAWISPSEVSTETFDLRGKACKGAAYKWGKR
jgi:hypothetical protein